MRENIAHSEGHDCRRRRTCRSLKRAVSSDKRRCSDLKTECLDFRYELVEPPQFRSIPALRHPFAETAKLVEYILAVRRRHIESGLHEVDPFQSEFFRAWEPPRFRDRLGGDRHQALFCADRVL